MDHGSNHVIEICCGVINLFYLLQCTYINGSPQNTFVPGVVELAEQKRVFLAGDDFKSGQTKVKSVLTDFLVSAGIKVSGTWNGSVVEWGRVFVSVE